MAGRRRAARRRWPRPHSSGYRGTIAGGADFIAPVFAAVILAAVDQKARGRAQRIVGLAERRHPAVTVIIHPDIEPDLRHPLGVSHRAGPRSPHLLRRAPAAIDDLQRIDQFGFPIGAAARFVPGQRRQRGKYRPHMVLLHQRIADRRIRRPTAPAACRARRRNPARSGANSASFFRSASLPSMMRQSETRRLMYCQISSLNSGWLCICLNTDMSGSMRPITRVQVASEMPFASARRENGRAIARSRAALRTPRRG